MRRLQIIVARFLAAVLMVLLTVAPGSAQSTLQGTTLQGTSPDIAEALQSGTNLPQLLKTPAVVSALGRGDVPEPVERERARLQELLVSLGYLRAQVLLDIEPASASAPADVRVRIDSGPQFRVGTVTFAFGGRALPALLDVLDDVAAVAGDQIASGDVLSRLQSDSLWQLGEAGYGFAEIAEFEISPQAQGTLADVSIRIETGAIIHLAEVRIDDVAPDLVHRVVSANPFEIGDAYSSRKFDAFREAVTNMPDARRARLELVALDETRFALEARARLSRDIGFDEKSSIQGMTVLGLTLLAIVAGLLLQANRRGRAGFERHLVSLTVLVLGVASIVLVAGRTASLI